MMTPLSIARLVALVSGLGLAGCQTAPPPPLFAPHDQARGYGYSENKVSDNVYTVKYLTPLHDVAYGQVARQSDIDAAKRTAEDMARWRAAEIALERGFPAFVVSDTRTDAEITDRRYDVGPYYPYPRYWHDPLYPFDPYYYHGWGFRRDTVAQVRATLTVTLSKTVGDGAIDAAQVRDQLAEKYPGQDARKAAPAKSDRTQALG